MLPKDDEFGVEEVSKGLGVAWVGDIEELGDTCWFWLLVTTGVGVMVTLALGPSVLFTAAEEEGDIVVTLVTFSFVTMFFNVTNDVTMSDGDILYGFTVSPPILPTRSELELWDRIKVAKNTKIKEDRRIHLFGLYIMS